MLRIFILEKGSEDLNPMDTMHIINIVIRPSESEQRLEYKL